MPVSHTTARPRKYTCQHGDGDADQLGLQVVEGFDLQPFGQLQVLAEVQLVEPERNHLHHRCEEEQVDDLDGEKDGFIAGDRVPAKERGQQVPGLQRTVDDQRHRGDAERDHRHQHGDTHHEPADDEGPLLLARFRDPLAQRSLFALAHQASRPSTMAKLAELAPSRAFIPCWYSAE
jgi:hypothetical protein